MSDILKEAIADAKAVRETALQNAKMALEEAFTPQLKNMLSAKLREDDIEEEDTPVEESDSGYDRGEEDPDGPAKDGQQVSEADFEDEEEVGDEEVPEEVPEEEPEVPAEEGYYEDDEVPGDEEAGGEDEFGDEEEVEEEDLDLETIIRELESELSEAEGDDEEGEEDVEGEEGEEGEEGDEEMEEEVDKTSGIGKSDNHKGESDQTSAIGGGGQEKAKKLGESTDDDSETVEVDESIFEQDEEKVEEIKSELEEYKQAVIFLKDKLHEVNILNAKLLFTNKLFKSYSLNNNQKLKVVETFDRAQTTREIKLVYSTLAEQFGDNGSIARIKSINESASAKSGSTKPSKASRKVITEEAQVANRFKKLAGLIK